MLHNFCLESGRDWTGVCCCFCLQLEKPLRNPWFCRSIVLAYGKSSTLSRSGEMVISHFLIHLCQTAVLYHDIDVEGHKPIGQHAYWVKPTKRLIMQKAVDYLTEHGFAIHRNQCLELTMCISTKAR